jgi:NitT/TauT family transport system substrate-binding protein
MTKHMRLGRGVAAGLIAAGMALGATAAHAQEPVRIAYGDVISVEALNLLIALEGAKERGVEVEFIEFQGEDIANEAVLGGQADIGVGTPYAVIQRSGAPIRMFYQLSALRFFPVANKEVYPDWASLDGGTFGVHTRGSGTEAMARLIEQTEGIAFGELSYVPGSDVRSLALIQGNLDAAFVDAAGRSLVMNEDPEKFIELPVPDVNATDEALFARIDWLEENQETVQIIVEELLKTWRKINEDPAFVAAERERLGLAPDLPDDLVAEITPYFEGSVASNVFPDDGGGANVAAADFAFYTIAGQLEGEPSELNAEDFWYNAPLEAALSAVQ